MLSTQEIEEVRPDSVNSKKKTWIFLTVPHQKCPEGNSKNHLCDILAQQASECLYNASLQIEKNQVTILKPFIPKIPRTECDFNREYCNMKKKEIPARGTEYRTQIREFITMNDKVKFVLDVHSYPPTHVPWKDAYLVVIDDKKPNSEKYTSDFVKFMNTIIIPTKIQPGDGNDIHVEMRELGKKSMLLEFNEILLENQPMLNEICKYIVIWFNRLK